MGGYHDISLVYSISCGRSRAHGWIEKAESGETNDEGNCPLRVPLASVRDAGDRAITGPHCETGCDGEASTGTIAACAGSSQWCKCVLIRRTGKTSAIRKRNHHTASGFTACAFAARIALLFSGLSIILLCCCPDRTFNGQVCRRNRSFPKPQGGARMAGPGPSCHDELQCVIFDFRSRALPNQWLPDARGKGPTRWLKPSGKIQRTRYLSSRRLLW